MKKGFNKYGNAGDEDQQVSQPSNQNNQHPNNSYSMVNQFTSFSPENSGFSETMIMSLFQVVQQQSQALQKLMKKVDTITERTVQLTQKIKQIKTARSDQKQGHHKDKIVAKGGESVKGGADILDPRQIVTILFGDDKKYAFKLKLAQKLELPLFRQRNFFLEIQLSDFEGKPVKNSNKIPLSLALYSTENPPKFIEKNTAGQKILKGYIEQSLHQGICRFQKIQIKEVTSHFRNGWVFIVIIPCMTPLGSTTTNSQTNIDYTKVEPLVLDRIVVKAKKLKETKMQNYVAIGEDMGAEEGVKHQQQPLEEDKI